MRRWCAPSRRASRASSSILQGARRVPSDGGARRRRNPEPRRRAGSRPEFAAVAGTTRPPTRRTSRRPRSSSMTSSTVSTSRAGRTRPGASGTTSTGHRARRVVVRHLSGRRVSVPTRPLGRPLLVTHRRPDGGYERFTRRRPAEPGPVRHRRVRISSIGASSRPPTGRGLSPGARAPGRAPATCDWT